MDIALKVILRIADAEHIDVGFNSYSDGYCSERY